MRRALAKRTRSRGAGQKRGHGLPRPLILQILRRHPQSLLLRLEPTRRHALENHVHRPPQLGLAVLINENWYKCPKPCAEALRMTSLPASLILNKAYRFAEIAAQ